MDEEGAMRKMIWVGVGLALVGMAITVHSTLRKESSAVVLPNATSGAEHSECTTTGGCSLTLPDASAFSGEEQAEPAVTRTPVIWMNTPRSIEPPLMGDAPAPVVMPYLGDVHDPSTPSVFEHPSALEGVLEEANRKPRPAMDLELPTTMPLSEPMPQPCPAPNGPMGRAPSKDGTLCIGTGVDSDATRSGSILVNTALPEWTQLALQLLWPAGVSAWSPSHACSYQGGQTTPRSLATSSANTNASLPASMDIQPGDVAPVRADRPY